MTSNLENLVESAKKGNKDALEILLLKIKDRVFGLAVRMLGHPIDAEDATQEILIKIITHLSTFRQESAFTSWVYRIAANHLLTIRKRRVELSYSSFDVVTDETMDIERPVGEHAQALLDHARKDPLRRICEELQSGGPFL